MAMRHTLSERDVLVAAGRAKSDLKSFQATMSDEMAIKSSSLILTSKTAPTMVRSCVRRSDSDLRNAFR